MDGDALQWHTWRIYKAVWDSLGEVRGGEVDFKVMDGFEVVLRDELILVLANWKGLGGGERGAGALRDPIDSNRYFPVMLTLEKFLAAFEIFRHMLDFNNVNFILFYI